MQLLHASEKNIQKQIRIKESQINIILHYTKTCDNTCQRNMGTKRIYEKNII